MNQELALNLFQYKDGKLFWKVNHPWRGDKGKEAGCWDQGYQRITVDYQLLRAHRIIYMMHYGDIPKGKVIDHINRDTKDNRIENLRCVDYSENNRNRSGTKGYTWRPKKNKFQAMMRQGSIRKHLGMFATESAARLAYLMEKLQWTLKLTH